MVERFQAGEMPVFLLACGPGHRAQPHPRRPRRRPRRPVVEPGGGRSRPDRAHGSARTKPVQVHRMITRGTIEEKVAELLT